MRRIDWSNVDWNKHDVHLAMILDVSRSTVKINRERLGIPQPPPNNRWDKYNLRTPPGRKRYGYGKD